MVQHFLKLLFWVDILILERNYSESYSEREKSCKGFKAQKSIVLKPHPETVGN